MKSSIPAPTKADLERFHRLQELGCIVMRLYYDAPETPGDIHHILSGGQRISHQATICLTPWAHQGQVPLGMTAIEAKQRLGPSKARHPEEFRAKYGSDEELLEATNQLLAAMARGRAA